MSADYITVKNKTGNNILKLDGKGYVTLNNTNNIAMLMKNPSQTNMFGLQNGSDTGGDYLRIGALTLDENGNEKTRKVFMRMNMDSNDTDGSTLTTLIRSNLVVSKDVLFGADNNYYKLSKGASGDDCVYVKRTVQDNTDTTKNFKDKQIYKWCPSS